MAFSSFSSFSNLVNKANAKTIVLNPPTNLSVTNRTSTSISINFSTVAGATSYLATATPLNITATSTNSPITINGLNGATTYTIIIQSKFQDITSIPSTSIVEQTSDPNINWYSILIKLGSTTIFNGYFTVNKSNNLITAFYYQSDFSQSILAPTSVLPTNIWVPADNKYPFTGNGVNISKFPYYNNSQYYNLAYSTPNYQVWFSNNPSNYINVTMTFTLVSDPSV